MRILTVLSAILLAAGGGFCYYFSTSAFSALAFVLGAVMVGGGVCVLLSYVTAIKTPYKLPDTVFVEGLVTLLFGFAVLNNQVSELMITTFYGTWLTLSGATRLSQSFSVSRHNSRDWAKIIPASMLCLIGGVVMLMQTLVKDYNPVALVGTAMLLNALSLLLYALYMKPHVLKQGEIDARARAAAKAKAVEEKRKEREEMRKMSRKERKAAKEALSIVQKEELEALREADARALAEAEANPAGSGVSGDTVSLTPEEVEEIREQTEEAYEAELKKAEAAEKAAEKPAEEIQEPRITAVNLAELEEIKEVEFEKVELPSPEYLASGGEAAKRDEFLKELDAEVKTEEENSTFTPVKLEELVAEEAPKSVSDAEKRAVEKRLTTSFHWPKKLQKEDL